MLRAGPIHLRRPAMPYFEAGGTPCGLYAARTLSGEWKILRRHANENYSCMEPRRWVDVSRTRRRRL